MESKNLSILLPMGIVVVGPALVQPISYGFQSREWQQKDISIQGRLAKRDPARELPDD